MNPDCAQGKHQACAGDAWDFDTDTPTRCDCDCHRPRTLRAITIRQPHAWAVIHAGKSPENRTRNIAGKYRGLVAIHAGLAKYEQDNMASRAHRAAHGTPRGYWMHVHRADPICSLCRDAHNASRRKRSAK